MIPIVVLLNKQWGKYKVFARWQIDFRDMWRGLFWQFFRDLQGKGWTLNLYICRLPCLPLFIQINKEER